MMNRADPISPAVFGHCMNVMAGSPTPHILNGMKPSLFDHTVTVEAGVVLLPGRWLMVTEPTAVQLGQAHGPPRIDLVVLRAYDDFWDCTGKTGASVEVIKGTPNHVAYSPSLAVNDALLMRVLLPPGGLPIWSTTVQHEPSNYRQNQAVCDHTYVNSSGRCTDCRRTGWKP